jgi:hypothetical protein
MQVDFKQLVFGRSRFIKVRYDGHTKNLTVSLKSRLPKTLKTIPQEAGHPNKGSLRPSDSLGQNTLISEGSGWSPSKATAAATRDAKFCTAVNPLAKVPAKDRPTSRTFCGWAVPLKATFSA